jgi:hypothetical protein
MGNAARHRYIGGYCVSVDKAVFDIYKPSKIQDLDLDVHVETPGATKYLLIDNVNPAADFMIHGLKIRDQEPQVKNWLRVFESAEAACSGHGEGQ